MVNRLIKSADKSGEVGREENEKMGSTQKLYACKVKMCEERGAACSGDLEAEGYDSRSPSAHIRRAGQPHKRRTTHQPSFTPHAQTDSSITFFETQRHNPLLIHNHPHRPFDQNTKPRFCLFKSTHLFPLTKQHSLSNNSEISADQWPTLESAPSHSRTDELKRPIDCLSI